MSFITSIRNANAALSTFISRQTDSINSSDSFGQVMSRADGFTGGLASSVLNLARAHPLLAAAVAVTTAAIAIHNQNVERAIVQAEAWSGSNAAAESSFYGLTKASEEYGRVLIENDAKAMKRGEDQAKYAAGIEVLESRIESSGKRIDRWGVRFQKMGLGVKRFFQGVDAAAAELTYSLDNLSDGSFSRLREFYKELDNLKFTWASKGAVEVAKLNKEYRDQLAIAYNYEKTEETRVSAAESAHASRKEALQDEINQIDSLIGKQQDIIDGGASGLKTDKERAAFADVSKKAYEDLATLQIKQINLGGQLSDEDRRHLELLKSIASQYKKVTDEVKELYKYESIRGSLFDKLTATRLDALEESINKEVATIETGHLKEVDSLEVKYEKAKELLDTALEDEKMTKEGHLEALLELQDDFGADMVDLEEIRNIKLGEAYKKDTLAWEIENERRRQARLDDIEDFIGGVGLMASAWEAFGQNKVDSETERLTQLTSDRDAAAAVGNKIEAERLNQDIKAQEQAIKDAEKAKKAAAISGVMIDLAGAIMGTWRGYSEFGPWGTAAAVAQTVGLAATAAAQIQAISNASSGASTSSATTGSSTSVESVPSIINEPPSSDIQVGQIQAYVLEDSLNANMESQRQRQQAGEI